MMRECVKREEGSLMLDGMIVMLLTIFILVYLMGFGFLLYQQWVVSNIANDTASRVAQLYAYPDADPIMGYVNADMIRQAPLYRETGGSQDERRDIGEKYAKWNLDQSSFAYPVSEPKIEVKEACDGVGRRHIEVRIEAEYEIPFGGALAFFGLKDTVTYVGVGEGNVQDLMGYFSAVGSLKGLTNDLIKGKVTSTTDKALKMVGKLIELFE